MDEDAETSPSASASQEIPLTETKSVDDTDIQTDYSEVIDAGYDCVRKAAQKNMSLEQTIINEYELLNQKYYYYDIDDNQFTYMQAIYCSNDGKYQIINSFNTNPEAESKCFSTFLFHMVEIYHDFNCLGDINVSIYFKSANITKYTVFYQDRLLMSYGFDSNHNEVINDIPDWLEDSKIDETLHEWLTVSNKQFWENVANENGITIDSFMR